MLGRKMMIIYGCVPVMGFVLPIFVGCVVKAAWEAQTQALEKNFLPLA